MMRFLKNNKGNSLIGALVAMVVLSAAAATVVTISGADTKSYTNNMQSQQALGVVNAGLQWSLKQLSNGYSPTNAGQNFGPGSFIVVDDPTSSLVTVTGTVGDATKTQSINADYARNCVDLIVSQAYIDAETLYDLQFIKNCNDGSILSKLTLTWNASSCAVGVNCDGSVDVDDEAEDDDDVVYEDVGEAPSGKIWICHVPPGNPENRQTLSVNINGWINGHKAGTGDMHNQDYLGPCIISEVEDEDGTVVTCEGTDISDESLEDCTDEDGDLDLTDVTLAGVTIFDAGVLPEGSSSTASGAETDVEDALMASNGTYAMDVVFDTVIPTGTWFTIVAEFADGSTLTGLFKAGNQAAPIPEVVEDDADDAEDEVVENFVVEDGVVTIVTNKQVTVDVLGAEIQCGSGGSEINVNVELCVDGNCSDLFSGGDVDGGESYSATTSNANSAYTIRGTASLSSCNNFSATYISTNTNQVKTLSNGDQSPLLDGFSDQEDVSAFLASYMSDTGVIQLDDNQVIMLFELGTDMSADPTDSAADFQDLVILMTISDI